MRDNDSLRLASGAQAPEREIGVVGYLLETQHGPLYRWACVTMAVGAAAIMAVVLIGAAPTKHPVVYRYQWPSQFGDQQMTICTGVAEDHDECPRAYTSQEL